MNIFKKYFSWLQKDVPTGVPEKFPLLDERGQTSVSNVFILGDLTGIPLLKIAIERTRTRFRTITSADDFFRDQKKYPASDTHFDVLIIGAGPAGMAAALEAKKQQLKYLLLESGESAFQTIRNFPKNKKMFYEPIDMKQKSSLVLSGNTKERLLEKLFLTAKKEGIVITTNTNVEKISSTRGGKQTVVANGKIFTATRTFVAIGKSGNARKIGCDGEDLPKVFSRLFDPTAFEHKNILVVGGGDSALEAAIALAEKNVVTLSYRGKELLRAKAENSNTVLDLAQKGKLTLLLDTNVAKITESSVLFREENISPIKNDVVFVLIGRMPPYAFLEKCGIILENSWSKMTKWWFAFSLSFANLVYFGKLSPAIPETLSAFQDFTFVPQLEISIAVLSFVATVFLFPIVAFDIVKNFEKYFQKKWHFLKYGFFIFAVGIFLWAFLGSKYLGADLVLFPDVEWFGQKGFGGSPYFWYGFLYTATIILFGWRRIITSKTRYVRRQTMALILIQVLPLFFIPNFLLPILNHFALIPEFIKTHIFLGEEWWRFVGFILAWPLFFHNIFTEEPSIFWLLVSFGQTFLLIPWMVIKWGKGAYCSWICSCGAMAETLGDEYRHLAPHGVRWKKAELAGQWILFAIVIVTLLHMANWFSVPDMLLEISKNATLTYKLVVDTFLAGTLGVGVYFFYSGRVWCRFFCPLSALMHIYQRIGSYRIFADKKKCISCGICTKVCHMGIDVMSYAQRGKPMDDVECVRCSACIRECPMGVLSHGRYEKLWGKNRGKVVLDKLPARKKDA